MFYKITHKDAQRVKMILQEEDIDERERNSKKTEEGSFEINTPPADKKDHH